MDATFSSRKIRGLAHTCAYCQTYWSIFIDIQTTFPFLSPTLDFFFSHSRILSSSWLRDGREEYGQLDRQERVNKNTKLQTHTYTVVSAPDSRSLDLETHRSSLMLLWPLSTLSLPLFPPPYFWPVIFPTAITPQNLSQSPSCSSSNTIH